LEHPATLWRQISDKIGDKMNDITRLIFALVFAVSTGYVVFNAPLFYKIFVIGGLLIIGAATIFGHLSKAKSNGSAK
jgi:hypothetical protein